MSLHKVLTLLLFMSPAYGQFAVDKVAHASVSYGLTVTGTLICRKIIKLREEQYTLTKNILCSVAAGTITALVGYVKEINDDPYDPNDMGANLIGVSAGIGMSVLVWEW